MHKIEITDLAEFNVVPQWPLTADDPAVIEWDDPLCRMTEHWTTNDGFSNRVRELLRRGEKNVTMTRVGEEPLFLYEGDVEVRSA